MSERTANIPALYQAEADIAFVQIGSAVDVRLTRPKALNALTHPMTLALYHGLQLWAHDETVSHVIISAEIGEKRAFCAGGDIRDLFAGFQAGTPRHAFFRDEYRLNDAIATFPKPYVALIDGLVMGGGAGISMHASHRIVTENTRFAMPEVAIGLVPDVGGSYFLPRLPNRIGHFLGLTGTMIAAQDCLFAGIGTHFCPAADIEQLRSALFDTADPRRILKNFEQTPQANVLAQNTGEILEVFSENDLKGILQLLQQKSHAKPFFADALTRINAASPLSVCLAFEQLKRGITLSLRECLKMEYQLVSRILHGPDLYEGIRAAIIDRSVPPRWQHASVETVDNAQIASFFTPLPDGDLTFGNE